MVKKDAMETLRTTLQQIERNIIELDSGLLKPNNATIEVSEEHDTQHVEASLTHLQEQLGALKGELEKAKE